MYEFMCLVGRSLKVLTVLRKCVSLMVQTPSLNPEWASSTSIDSDDEKKDEQRCSYARSVRSIASTWRLPRRVGRARKIVVASMSRFRCSDV